MSLLLSQMADGSIPDRFRSAKVLVVGDVMLDEYIVGAVSRICPEAPVPVLDVRSRYSSGGGAANVALNIASLGASVQLVGMAGQDTAGDSLRQLLREAAIPVEGLVDAGSRGTISKTRIVAGQQQICRIDHESKADLTESLLDRLTEATRELIGKCSVVVLSDYAKGTLTDRFCAAIIALARELNKPVIVDPKAKDLTKYRGCAIVTPNAAEASEATGIEITSDSSLRRAGRALAEQLPDTSILITRGPDGMALFESGAEPALIPTVARQVFNVVGAGDTVVATLAVAVAAGLSLFESVVCANLAAGIVVEKPGTACVSLEELLDRQVRSVHSTG